MTAIDPRWFGEVDATLKQHRDDLDELRSDLTHLSNVVVDVRLDVRGLVVRVALYAAIAASLASAVIAPLIYLTLAHFGVHKPH